MAGRKRKGVCKTPKDTVVGSGNTRNPKVWKGYGKGIFSYPLRTSYIPKRYQQRPLYNQV